MKWLVRIMYRLAARYVSAGLVAKLPILTFLKEWGRRTLRATEARVHGNVMQLGEHDSLDLSIHGQYEPRLTRFVQGRIEGGAVVADIGANIGYYTLLLSGLVGPTGRVYAFEPEPGNFSILSENVSRNGCENVILVQAAVTERSGTVPLFLSARNAGDHRISDPMDGRTCIEASGVSLDDFLENREAKIDFIKIDIQGAEVRALRGMLGILRRSPEITVLTEVWPEALALAGTSVQEFLEMLHSQGFKMCRIEENGRRSIVSKQDRLLREPHGNAHWNLVCERGERVTRWP